MSAGVDTGIKADRQRAPTRRWRSVSIGAAIVITSVIAAHAAGLPVSSNGQLVTNSDIPPAPPAYLGAANVEVGLDSAHSSEQAPAQRFTGVIGPDLSLALQRAGVPEKYGREYVAILARAIPLENGLSVDDRFDLIIERLPDGSFGELVFVGMDRIARADVALMKWTDGREIVWINGDGVGGEASQEIARPVNGRVTSGFGSRFHPVLGYARMHKGVDLAAGYGSPIAAAADGRVASAGWNGGYGKQVALSHGDGMVTTYGHMSRIAAAPGQQVRRGQVIGYVGSTGLSTGPHLHFEVMKNGRPINPLSAKLANLPAQLQGEKLHAFKDQLRRVLVVPGRN